MASRIAIFLLWASVGTLPLAAAEPPAAPSMGPLRVHSRNPRYFADGTGRAVLLVGSHTWNSLQDMDQAGSPPEPFDFDAYLEFLARRDHNFIRLWRWELFGWDTKANQEKAPRHLIAGPHPWARTGPGSATDGKPRFDLTKFDDSYFQRLRSRVEAARKRGIYVSVMLFEGWGLRFVDGGWKSHPFHPLNNINGIAGGPAADAPGITLLTLKSPAVTALQESYVRKVIDTVNDLDNVLYEIANESDFETTEWQYHMIRFIKQTESPKPRQHPVGMTSIGYGVDDLERLLKSPADWISPNPDKFDYKDNPPAADGAKVILSDTDHLWGVGGNVAWAWKSALRGVNPIFMDPYRRGVLDRGPDTQWEPVRRALGVARRLAERVDLAAITPRTDLATTGYCLARPGNEYLVYLSGGGEVTVDLTPAKEAFTVEWIHPVEGTVTRCEDSAGGEKRTFRAPAEGDAVLHLRGKDR